MVKMSSWWLETLTEHQRTYSWQIFHYYVSTKSPMVKISIAFPVEYRIIFHIGVSHVLVISIIILIIYNISFHIGVSQDISHAWIISEISRTENPKRCCQARGTRQGAHAKGVEMTWGCWLGFEWDIYWGFLVGFDWEHMVIYPLVV
jgi:hypothetical protein